MSNDSEAALLGRATADRGHRMWVNYWLQHQGEPRVEQEESKDYVSRLTRHVRLTSNLRVLDFGCGTGRVARLVAPRVNRVDLWDGSERMRQHARDHTADLPNVRLIDLEDPAQDPVAAYDLVIVNSVIQYMFVAEFHRWMGRLGPMLAPGGQVVLSDVLGPRTRLGHDLVTSLWFAASRGCLLDTLRHFARTLTWYRTAQRTQPLTRFSEQQIEDLRSGGWNVTRLPENLTFRPGRQTLIAARLQSLVLGLNLMWDSVQTLTEGLL